MARRTIWWESGAVAVLDQRALPHELVVRHWSCVADAVEGIRDMQVRGAPLIGVAAAHGVALAMAADPSDAGLAAAQAALGATRPTAVNLGWALAKAAAYLRPLEPATRAAAARQLAQQMADDDAARCRAIGEAGAPLVAEAAGRTGRAAQVLTHCNAGWLACVEWGTALAPVYVAHERGVPVHVWVSETRPRNQGASLTAWELAEVGVPHTLVVDNAAGHLLASGLVDLVLVGADRIAANGDVANKVGTYLKALAARAHAVPCYVAAPRSSFDPDTATGAEIPIEERGADEVLEIAGRDHAGQVRSVRLAPAATVARNWAFDVTPAALVTGYVTEDGVER